MILMGVKYSINGFVARRPALFRAWYSRPRYRDLIIKSSTELVIDGFPRCANSFAVLAFESVQPAPVEIAHHLHAEAQLALGVKFGCPVLVLVREPMGAVASLVTRNPLVSPDQALRRYHEFYSFVCDLGNSVVVADFLEVTRDYGAVISRLNTRFGSKFALYQNSQASDYAIFSQIDALNQKKYGGDINMVSRPKKERSHQLQSVRESIENHSLSEACKDIYNRVAPSL